MAITPFTKKLVETAQQQYQLYKSMDEADEKLCKQIRKYYTDLGFTFTSCVDEPWSAVFISWCVLKGGANATEFKFSVAHSKFVYKAIQNATQAAGVFRARKLNEYKPKIGDIIHNNRGNSTFDYEYAKNHESYQSHSAIVVEVGEDSGGRYLLTVGGNESDSVRMKEIRLDKNGFIKQRSINPYISIIETLK
ncbi:hypothetical protein SAMN05421594_3033 [Chryseobacterium oleae]|uniref:DUF2272 domain-containing protein n=1 Tax=Chryseobacterium oleae TaxID=491207 RepID=A0A1I4ZJM4_CHROL|nr:DUF2272 domain-containing protein [Chryseobacterium oleae]SFN50408.1 hypothetical protein SAMN05421594_3033 [Chryseobacterium oleae]